MFTIQNVHRLNSLRFWACWPQTDTSRNFFNIKYFCKKIYNFRNKLDNDWQCIAMVDYPGRGQDWLLQWRRKVRSFSTSNCLAAALVLVALVAIPHICRKYHKWDMWRKICHVEKFQMHERCGKIWNFSTCGVISNFSTCQMWRILKFLHNWHV